MSATEKPSSDALTAYRAKRSLEGTPEPAGASTAKAGRLFVVHKHAARRLHYDLRLQMGPVLESWAVPRGPSKDPADKRLAVKVEDHPLEYGDFEGVIPEGNYGAGAVILWDRGVWVPIEDPEEGVAKGKLLFELKGYKLRGRWTLVKIKKSEKEWLLIKERDALASVDGDAFPQASILSGLTVEELRDGRDRAAPIREALERAGVPTERVAPSAVELMLAETRERPFSRSGWVYEIKYDGYRIIAARENGEPRLLTRNGHDATATFPEVARAVDALPFEHVVLDGEVVVHDDEGLPSFQRLQKRGRLSRSIEIGRAAVELPAALYVFDLLGFEDFDVRQLPLVERKSLLKEVLPPVGPLRYSDHLEEQGEHFFEEVQKMKLEGIIAKKADSLYRGGRSAQWIKVRADKSDDFVVVGFTQPKRSRSGFGALHLAQYADGELVYAGRVGTGFDTKQLLDIRAQLDSLRRPRAPCSRAPDGDEHVWVDPELVCEVRYREWTAEALLRHPAFLRFRDDKDPKDCVKSGGKGEAGNGFVPAATLPASRFPLPDIQFSNLDKVFWPDEGFTKGDLIDYYRTMAPWILPYLKDRPVVMTRFPDGIDGKSFFQKDAPAFAPDWVRRERMWSEDSERELNYFVADNEASLLYIANLGTIPLHIWGSRVSTLEQPDWCILDLDPKEAPFTNVVTIARALRELCDDLDLPSYVKTSGSSGLHVLVPMGRQCTYGQTRTFGELLARLVAAELPEIATITRSPTKREGKVYIDYLQNGRGRLLVSPFCVRPLAGAPVSMPLRWREITAKLNPGRFTIRSAARRMKRLGEDPLRSVLDETPDLASALERLNELL